MRNIAEEIESLKAEARALKEYGRKLRTENERHAARIAELAAERDAKIAKARGEVPWDDEDQALAMASRPVIVPTGDEDARDALDGDATIDPTQVPEALTRPYVPRSVSK